MPRLLRIYLLACIALAFAYLVVHAGEPLRLNIGDSWSDANAVLSVEYVRQHGFAADPLTSDPYHPTSYPPLAEIVYGTIGKLGLGDIVALRWIAIAFSGLAAMLLFQYARRIWDDSVAMLATALFTTSLLWTMYADSIARPPIMHAACFLALWGLVRAIDTKELRHYAAAAIGSFACLFAAYDDSLFLPAAVLFTIHVKLGNPLARGRRHFLIVCVAGYLAAYFAKSWFVVSPVGGPAAIDGGLTAPLATLLRRYTLLFTPMFWVTVGFTIWSILRASSLRSVLADRIAWMLAVAVVFLNMSSLSTSLTLRALPLLPFYAIGSASLIVQLVHGGRSRRALAIAWAVLAPAWSFTILLSHPRSVLARDDVAAVNAYFASNDRNDFVMSNLLSDGPTQAAFDRHSWTALENDPAYPHAAQIAMLGVLESAGTDYVHAVIFTTPESRFVDRALEQIVRRPQLASVRGWPHLNRRKANDLIRDYDKRVLKTLEVVGAKKVLHLSNFDLYRIDRSTVRDMASRSVPVTQKIDFSSPGADKYKLLGWGEAWVTQEEQLGVTTLHGYVECLNPLVRRPGARPVPNACETVLTESGMSVSDVRVGKRAELMLRVERACDLRLTIMLASPALLGLSFNDFTASQCDPGEWVSFLVPKRSVRAGINVLGFESQQFGTEASRTDFMSLVIEPMCESEP